jgi:hypothetical protein
MEKLGLYAERSTPFDRSDQQTHAENAGHPEAFRSRSEQHSYHESPARLKK